MMSRSSHQRSWSAWLKASATGMIGLSITVAQNRTNHTSPRATRNFERSHVDIGLRVRLSSGAPRYSGGGVGPVSGPGQARPGGVPVGLISRLPCHGSLTVQESAISVIVRRFAAKQSASHPTMKK